MTPANPDALADARDLIRHSLKVGAPGLSDTAREAVLRSITLKLEGKVFAPLLADLQRVTAERDEAREVVARCNNSFGSYSYHLNPHPAEQIEKVKWQSRSEWQRAEAAEARSAQLQAEVEALKEDAARLDFLDGCNARLNASYGTHYGWKLVLNHNVNRLMLGDMKVDLHDSEGGNDKLPSCRLAIDQARARTALAARAATAREG
ncbi:UNVERIFIED_ORG: hypothetical protein M2438_002693 [Methylobacterium sp. SuP10 SLI 274]|uniref:hypothetical protein n=1 Tax=Methylorubrum extorquens TaxID=408 RepID=UPI00209E17CF|nr:hypothetical protein [Methylorubrum extorquens]MDF9863925.1 hypothetical protein [Methylorubrum pseudosasae]MDH6637518.1 hypothetical protein [Methylobacterium sp. SuP10 SLI 274]MDH6666698.1 hypothetical protein [Methylorubrum zatmanii]MCP1558606.1 hypothetical protein [Methylorubrum extorquens]MDF9792235.1 hypothetical protein [Methylorubrum extorquens]